MRKYNDRDIENLLMHVVTCKPGFDDALNTISDRMERIKDTKDLLLWHMEFKPNIEFPFEHPYDLDRRFYDKIRKLRAEMTAEEMKLSEDELMTFWELRPGDVLAYLEKVRKVREEKNAGVQTENNDTAKRKDVSAD